MKATYYAHMGDDNMIVDMARASFSRRAADYSPEANARLIRFLARGLTTGDHKAILEEAAGTDDHATLEDCFKRMNAQTHWAPLAHPQITLFIEAPIFVARQDFKHIVGFVRSETSRRYVDGEPTFHVPEVWRARPEGSVKQGSGKTHPKSELLATDYQGACRRAVEVYQSMIEKGAAPEQARMVLPQSMMTTYFTTGSLAAWARAYNQRMDDHAQAETRELARQWGEIIAPLFPVGWAALTG